MERAKILNEYYTNLDYDERDKEKEVLKKLHDIIETIHIRRIKYDDDITKRLQILTEIIYQNMPFFSSIFKHIDVIFTILHYLTEYSLIIANKSEITLVDYKFDNIPSLLVITLVTVCTGSVMHSFFLDCLVDTSQNIMKIYNEISSILKCTDKPYTRNEMIILEDSDLYAVINCLIISDHFPLYKIWVQKRVHEKFVWLMKNYRSELSITIDTFQSVKDIQFLPCENIIRIVSIWSEDIVAAKNLALSINSHVVFINTYMDFHRSTLLWIYKHISMQLQIKIELNELIKNTHEPINQNQESSTNVVNLSSVVKMENISVGNLFYDGAWQKPTKGMYWKHNDSFWANATLTDIKKCYQSANKGFKTWSNMSIKARIQILSRFTSTLKLTGKFVLAAIVERLMRFPYFYKSIQGWIENEMIEILNTRIPLGVFILREENENILFFRLMQTLIAGNSVIVIFDANFCNPSSYYDMFSTCGIPSGVINLLSHKNTRTLESILCLEEYATYANRYFLRGTSKNAYILPFKKLTIEKRIIIPLQ